MNGDTAVAAAVAIELASQLSALVRSGAAKKMKRENYISPKKASVCIMEPYK